MEPDWSREAVRHWWDPSRQLLRSIRGYQRSRYLKRLWVLRYRFWSIVTGAEIPLGTRIGGGLLLPHPNGIVIHPAAQIGTNCLIMQQVTLGTNRDAGGAPVIGNGVDIGPGSHILGPVVIGDGALIGAGSLVLKDVAPRETVAGRPARPLRPQDGTEAKEEGRFERSEGLDAHH
jgi:serine O-acetyltransferase